MLKTFNRVGETLTINTFFMNKVKMFFIAAAMLLTTAGVFAGKARFNISSAIFAYKTGVGFVRLSPDAQSINFQTSGATQSTITDQGGNVYYLYGSASTTTPLYSTSAW